MMSLPRSSDWPFSWTPALNVLHDRWLVVEANVRHYRFDRSPFVPRIFEEFVNHTAEFAALMEGEKRMRASSELTWRYYAHAQAAQRPRPIDHDPRSYISALRELGQNDDRSTVLGLNTIWSNNYQPNDTRPEALWPSPEEFKEEGDERHTSGFGRCLPIPRVPGNPTVVWKQRNFKKPYELDFVLPVPIRVSDKAEVEVEKLPSDFAQTTARVEDQIMKMLDNENFKKKEEPSLEIVETARSNSNPAVTKVDVIGDSSEISTSYSSNASKGSEEASPHGTFHDGILYDSKDDVKKETGDSNVQIINALDPIMDNDLELIPSSDVVLAITRIKPEEPGFWEQFTKTELDQYAWAKRVADQFGTAVDHRVSVVERALQGM